FTEVDLLLAAVENKIDKVQEIITEGKVNINCKDADGKSPLMSAVIEGNVDVVEKLTKVNGVNVNLQDKNENSALHFIQYIRKDEIKIRILEILFYNKNLNVNLINNLRRTPLFDIIEEDAPVLTKFLDLAKQHPIPLNVNLKDFLGRIALERL